jgi:hypothetical protein
MIPLNQYEIAWLERNLVELNMPEGSSVAAEVYTNHGLDGVAKLHKAIIGRSIRKIQNLLDSQSKSR